MCEFLVTFSNQTKFEIGKKRAITFRIQRLWVLLCLKCCRTDVFAKNLRKRIMLNWKLRSEILHEIKGDLNCSYPIVLDTVFERRNFIAINSA